VTTALRWIGALGIVTIAIIRCVVAFSPRLVFDIDPAIDPTPLPGLGPAGSLLLDALLMAACGCGLLGEALARRGLDWTLLALAVVPAPIVFWHGAHDLLDLWRGSTWLAAALACVVVAHLGRDRSLRLTMCALLVAVLVPILVRGATQSRFAVPGWSLDGPEHAETLAAFEDHKEEFLADHGWAPGSPAARIYERRLRQASPRGWFPTSNIFASMMAFGLVMSVGLAIGAARDRLGGAWLSLWVIGALVTAGAILQSGSKGAMLAAAAGLLFLLAAMRASPARAFVVRHGGVLAVGLVAVVLLAVVVRGTLLPESWLGEKSLLFRWHYLVGAGRTIANDGLLGVGPDGFKAAYVGVRIPRSPEEVTSAHSVFTDWLSMLGIVGTAWVALAAILVWRAGRGQDVAHDDSGESLRSRTTLFAVAAVAVLGLMPAMVIEGSEINTVWKELTRGVGVLGFVVVACALNIGLERTRGAIVRWTLTAATIALIMNSQIEVTFFDPGSVTWAMCILGLAGGAELRPRGHRAAVAAGPILIAAACVLIMTCVIPAARAQAVMVDVARRLNPTAGSPGQPAIQREAAADRLERAYRDLLPIDAALIDEAIGQRLEAALLSRGARRLAMLDSAISLADEAVKRHGRPTLIARAAAAYELRATLTGSAADWDAAVGYGRRITEIDPHAIGSWRRLGDLLWAAGRRDEAADAYRRALDNDANFELDPLKQLSESDREALRGRL